MTSNHPATVLGRLEESLDAFESYVLRNATVELNHDVVLAFIQRQKELGTEMKEAQILYELTKSVELVKHGK